MLVQSSPLAGFQYYAGKSLWTEMKVGDALTLVREPANPHDANAVRVEWRGQALGYVPRRENRTVAQHMDRGGNVEARISRLLEHRNPWQREVVDSFIQSLSGTHFDPDVVKAFTSLEKEAPEGVA